MQPPPASGATRQLADVASLALEEARRQGASQCEADASLAQGLSVSVRLREVDTLEYQRDRGLGGTVYFGQRKGSARSEGRRVGKECRSRWSPDHLKKKQNQPL